MLSTAFVLSTTSLFLLVTLPLPATLPATLPSISTLFMTKSVNLTPSLFVLPASPRPLVANSTLLLLPPFLVSLPPVVLSYSHLIVLLSPPSVIFSPAIALTSLRAAQARKTPLTSFAGTSASSHKYLSAISPPQTGGNSLIDLVATSTGTTCLNR